MKKQGRMRTAPWPQQCWCSASAGTSQPDSSGGIILAAVWLPRLYFYKINIVVSYKVGKKHSRQREQNALGLF